MRTRQRLKALMNFQEYQRHIERSSIGKILPDAVYIHVSLLPQLPSPLQDFINETVAA